MTTVKPLISALNAVCGAKKLHCFGGAWWRPRCRPLSAQRMRQGADNLWWWPEEIIRKCCSPAIKYSPFISPPATSAAQYCWVFFSLFVRIYEVCNMNFQYIDVEVVFYYFNHVSAPTGWCSKSEWNLTCASRTFCCCCNFCVFFLFIYFKSCSELIVLWCNADYSLGLIR